MVGIVIGLIFLLIVFIIIIASYYSKKWSTEKELHSKREKVLAESNNVKFCMNKYRREIQRAKEILSLGFIALKNDKVELDGDDVKKIVPASHFKIQNYNIYYLLGEVLKTVNKAESDFLYSVERANARLSQYNSYIKGPVFPKMVADNIGYKDEQYGVEDLKEIDNLLDQRIAKTEELENHLNRLLPQNKVEGTEDKGLKK